MWDKADSSAILPLTLFFISIFFFFRTLHILYLLRVISWGHCPAVMSWKKQLPLLLVMLGCLYFCRGVFASVCVFLCIWLPSHLLISFLLLFLNNWAEMAWLVFQGTKYIYSELNSLPCSPSIVLGQCPNYTLDLLPAICILTRALWLCPRKNRVMSGLWQGCSLFFSWYPFRSIVRHKADGVPVCGRQSVLVA